MPALTRLVAVALATTALAAVGLVACSDTVAVVPPAPAREVAAVCAALTGALPQQVGSESRRSTTPESALTAAWGSPAIVLRCGVGEPTAFRPRSKLVTVNGVDWFAEQRPDGYVFTTWGRTVRVEVSVPKEYAPEVNPLVDLAEPIKATIPKV